ncbi:Ethylene-responsive transcription factor [Vigna angularis]|nr:Ethylene-responsive transcription factor [Vigna angularis]
MCGPKARTNFPYNPNEPHSSSSKLLSATLTAKLHKCHMASLSLQMAKQKSPQNKDPQPSEGSNPFASANVIVGSSAETGFRWTENRHEELRWLEGNWVSVAGQVEVSHQQFQPVLEDDHIEQMIQELLDYGSIELCSVCST